MGLEREKEKHQELMDLLDSVPGVKEYMESIPVSAGLEILQCRLALGITHAEAISLLERYHITLTTKELALMEYGRSSVPKAVYISTRDALRQEKEERE